MGRAGTLSFKLSSHCHAHMWASKSAVHTYAVSLSSQVATDNLDRIKCKFEFSKENIEPLIKTCRTTLSSKV